MTDRHRGIVLPVEDLKKELQRRTRRSFLIGGLAAAAGVGGYTWMRTRNEELGVPWPQRRILSFNRKLAEGYLSDGHLTPTYSLSQVTYLKPNGDIGLDDEVNNENWKVKVQNDSNGQELPVTLSDIMALPKISMITKFCCIEGWSSIAHWSGARFSDFTRKYLPPGQPLPKYVYMTTPSEDYYVGLDMRSAMHPQTLLAYEKDGKPLEDEHGAPLRLVIPVKYGIKNIKRIGSIQYTNNEPSDYWNELGYDWFAGL